MTLFWQSGGAYLVIGIILVGGLIYLVQRGYLRAWWKTDDGKFRELAKGDGKYRFQTDFGTFQLEKEHKRLLFQPKGATVHTVPYDLIQRLDISYETHGATFRELCLGMDVWDYFPKYQDAKERYTISLVLKDGKRVPLFSVGEFTHKEPFSDFINRIIRSKIVLPGTFRNAEELNREVAATIQSAFNQFGKTLHFTGV